MTTAFQPDGFQGQAFQIGAEATSIIIDEIIPVVGATITTVIAVTGWVFAGTPNPAPNFLSYEAPAPPVRAPIKQTRPYDDPGYRYADNPQAAMALQEPARPSAVPKAVIRNDDNVFIPVGPILALTEPLRPVTIPTRRGPVTVLLPSDVFIPPVVAASYPHTGPQPALVPAGFAQNFAPIDTAFIFVAPTPPGVDYPVGLTEPERPKHVNPRPTLRIDMVGTVGVFFYEISQPFDWGNPQARQTARPPLSRRYEADVYIAPATPAVFPVSLKEPERPRYPIFRSPRFDADPFITPPTPDYGWYSEPQRPTQQKPSNARNLIADVNFPVAGSTIDYGWFAEPRLPVQQKSSSGIYLVPETFLIIAGTTPDYGWYSEPQRPVQVKPPNYIYLIPDYWPWENIRPDEGHPHFGGWPHKKGGHLKKKKRKEIPAFEDRLPTARQTLLQVLADIQERQDEEDILMILKKIYDS